MIILYLILLAVVSLPGILLIYAAHRFKSRVRKNSGNFILLGSIMIMIHLLISSGTYLVTSLGDASDLADYALFEFWAGTVLKYLGLLAMAVGLLMYRVKDTSNQ